MRLFVEDVLDAPEFPAACTLAVGTVVMWLIPVVAL